ncbi:DUF87 domain-containing protein [candidate division WWE3 bacterium]|nr:DUF87 domain-containing protein [candidate division WWE3 bacterium]
MNIPFLNKKKEDKAAENPGEQMENKEPAETLAEGMVNIQDIIAPSAIEVDFNHIKVGNSYYRTLFVSGYPRFVGANWLAPVINFEHTLDISMFYYPVKAKMILDDLRRKITELEATSMSDREKGKLTDPAVKAALEDANALQEQLVKGIEKYFQFSFYITIPASSLEELNNVTAKLESTLGSLLLISKTSTLQMEEAFQSTVPTGMDKLLITRNMDTTSLATTFPFTSSELTMDEGIMYGINRHNGSLIIFDRFSLENANSVVFAKSGSGKSYFVKLEALRLMVFGAEVMIIDPEEEYRTLCEAVGGNYIDFSANSPQKINPFDLSGIAVEGENELGQKLLSLHTLLKLMMGDLNPTEEAILDRALIETYRLKGITSDPDTQMTKEPPVMEDLYKVLLGSAEEEAHGMAERLEKYVRGSLAGIFDSQTSVDLNSGMTVFSTKNLEELLRPIAFYIILDFVWTTIRRDLKKRILIVEEAWYLMENEDSARFIYGIAKRARKYYLGLTTISQDVDDFLKSEYGKAIVTNSSIQVLLKQHPAAIDLVAETFYLSEGEKRLLLGAGLGEGLFFAGTNHVAIRIKASPEEHKLITTNPKELLKLRKEGIIEEKKKTTPQKKYKSFKPTDTDKYETFDESGKPKEGYKPQSKEVKSKSSQAQGSKSIASNSPQAQNNVIPDSIRDQPSKEVASKEMLQRPAPEKAPQKTDLPPPTKPPKPPEIKPPEIKPLEIKKSQNHSNAQGTPRQQPQKQTPAKKPADNNTVKPPQREQPQPQPQTQAEKQKPSETTIIDQMNTLRPQKGDSAGSIDLKPPQNNNQ